MANMLTFNSQTSCCKIRNRYISELGILPDETTKERRKIQLLPPIQIGERTRSVDKEQRTSLVDHSGPLAEEIPELSLKGLVFLESQSLSSVAVVSDVVFVDDIEEDESSFFDDEEAVEEEMTSFDQDDPCKDEELPSRKNNRVHFLDSVQIREIPSRRSYSQDEYNSMWTSFQVQDKIAKRNSLEFWADQRDWRNVCEEEDMIQTKTGEFVHPATWKLLCEHMAYLQRQEAIRCRVKAVVSSKHAGKEFLRRMACVNAPSSLTRFADT